MKAFIPAVILCASACFGQQTFALDTGQPLNGPPTLPDLPDNAVIAVFDDGAKFTMGEMKRIFDTLPPAQKQNALRQQKAFVEQWALMRKLAAMAEKEGIDKQDSIQTQLLYSRLMILSQAKLQNVLTSQAPTEEDLQKFYEANKDRYKEVRVKAIYIAFGTGVPAGKKQITEAEAKNLAEKLLKQINSGADFAKLVKENSDDETSRDKDGDFATFRPRDNIPEPIRVTVFALKQGETSGPIRQANGFYLLRADEVKYRQLTEVRQELLPELQQQQYGKWLSDTNGNLKVEFPNPLFFGPAPTISITPTPAPPAAPPGK